jgi:hypothetical protein
MNITNQMKNSLKSRISEYNLDESMFKFYEQNQVLHIRFKNDYFYFQIKRLNEDTFESSIAFVDNINPQNSTLDWINIIVKFKIWLKGISDEMKYSIPKNTVEFKKFPPEVLKYSKQFIEIYNQSLTAEKNGLTEICGLGYRKSFEFLIKDYLIKKYDKPEHEKIKTMPISSCINEYVTNDEIKLLAHRVLWLGNDHAHYLKKWKGKTLTDLKNLIELTIKWIVMKDELSKVEKNMPKRK